jgi:ABC-type nickel/cobalt efflux system permease component RcnA
MGRHRGRLLFLFLSSLCLCVSVVSPVFAHPIPKDNHDRTITVWVTRQALIVDYRLELDEGRAARDLTEEELVRITTPQQLYPVFTYSQGAILARNLDARIDGKPLTLTCDETPRYTMPEMGHLICDYRFRALWSIPADRPWRLTFQEGNYSEDDFSRLQLVLQAGSNLQLSAVTAPDETLWQRPAAERKPGDGKRLRRLAATVTGLPGEPPAEYKVLPPLEAESLRSGPKGRKVAEARSAPSEPVAFAKSGRESPEASPEPAVTQGSPSLLHLLLDTRKGFAVLLLMAAGLGAAHALTPGHGKTLVAAYLVGERGTVWHALLLGLVTTLTHTGAVLLLACIGFFFPNAVGGTMMAAQLLGGLAIALLGFWLLLRRLSGQADHVHLPGHGHHHHGSGHSHTHDYSALSRAKGVGWWPLVVLGMQGGLVPCGDAIVVLSVAATTGRLALALPLLLAFSAGLAAVLVGLGVSVVSGRRWAGARWGNHPRLRRLVAALPILSALVIMGMGFWLCYDSVHLGSAGSVTGRN